MIEENEQYIFRDREAFLLYENFEEHTGYWGTYPLNLDAYANRLVNIL